MIVRPADPEHDVDLDEVTRLRLRFLAEHRRVDAGSFTPAFVAATRRWLHDHHRSGQLHSWLAVQGERPVGLASIVVHDLPPLPEDHRSRDGRLLHVWVEPRLRRCGVGAELVARCLAAAESLGLRSFSLHATDDGRMLYEGLGFEQHPAWMERRAATPRG